MARSWDDYKTEFGEQFKPLFLNKANKVLGVYEVSSGGLTGIAGNPRVIFAAVFCKEVIFSLHDKIYSAIGFKNNADGYELRNPYFKCSRSPKDITTINKNSSLVMVLEGFFDFLSYQSIYNNQEVLPANFVILNSLSLFEKARPFLEEHEEIHLYFDNDMAGQNFSRNALSLSNKYRDESMLYKNYKDQNEWLVTFGKAQKQTIRKYI